MIVLGWFCLRGTGWGQFRHMSGWTGTGIIFFEYIYFNNNPFLILFPNSTIFATPKPMASHAAPHQVVYATPGYSAWQMVIVATTTFTGVSTLAAMPGVADVYRHANVCYQTGGVQSWCTPGGVKGCHDSLTGVAVILCHAVANSVVLLLFLLWIFLFVWVLF